LVDAGLGILGYADGTPRGPTSVRFSLKWILAGTVYVAIAAAAFSFAEKTWIYCDLLWALTLLTIVYFGVVVFCASGRQRATAAGFVLAAVCFLLILAFGDGKGTAYMVLNRCGISTGMSLGPPSGEVLGGARVHSLLPGMPVTVFNRYLRAANAVATLAFGLMGSLVGLMAFRASASGDVREHDCDMRR
jgi:hypothetical protein